MSQDPEPLVIWKHEPKPKKPLVLWKHELRSKNPRPLKTWARIQNLWSSENMSQSPKILGLWKHEPGSVVLHVSISCTYSKKKKKNLRAWTTFGPDPPTKRYIGNLPRDLVHILIHYMTIYIFIYMHHTFTTVKYLLQSWVSLSYIDIRFSSFANEEHSVDTLFCNLHLTSHGG